MVTTLPADVRAGSTVLLLTSRSEDGADGACLRLLGGDEPRRRHVVALTFDRPAEVFVDAWIDHVGVQPADLNVVDVGTDARSVAAEPAEPADPSPSCNVVRSVGDPRDLATVVEHVEELSTEPIAADETRIVHLDSLSAGLREVGPRAAFDFVEDLRDLVRRTGSVGFVRVDRTAHSDHTIDVVAALVDAALELDASGGGSSWTIRPERRALGGFDGGDATPSIDDLFELLSHRQRRLALHHLSEAEEPMTTFDLATRIAGIEPSRDDPTDSEAFTRTYTGLVHVHLPKLEACGVVSVDAEDDSIRLREPAEQLEPLVALTVTDDLRR